MFNSKLIELGWIEAVRWLVVDSAIPFAITFDERSGAIRLKIVHLIRDLLLTILTELSMKT